MLRGLRYKIFGQAANEDIKELLLGIVFTAGVMISLIVGLNIIGILE